MTRQNTRWRWAVLLIVMQLAAIGTTGSAAAAEATVVARPDGDIRSEWRLAGSAAPTSASTALDDPVTQPTSVTAADYVYAGSAGKVTEVRVADVPLGHRVATAARGWFYANTGAATRLQVDLLWQGTVRASTIVPAVVRVRLALADRTSAGPSGRQRCPAALHRAERRRQQRTGSLCRPRYPRLRHHRTELWRLWFLRTVGLACSLLESVHLGEPLQPTAPARRRNPDPSGLTADHRARAR